VKSSINSFSRTVKRSTIRLLPLERLAFEHLGNAPPQKIDSRLHVFFEAVGLARGNASNRGRSVNLKC